MKQITPEIKARIFALYWGQRILKYTKAYGTLWMVEPTNTGVCFSLEVKPLSSITDEDAIGVAKIIIGSEYVNGRVIRHEESIHVTVVKPNTTRNGIVNIFHDGGFMSALWGGFIEPLPAYDYLRSKGYALPAFGYSVDELVEAGIFKLKGEQ